MSDAKRPWEETWIHHTHEVVDEDEIPLAEFLGKDGVPYSVDVKRAKLAAQAPAMAQILLDLSGEAAGSLGGEAGGCTYCTGGAFGQGGRHKRMPDGTACPIDAVLRAAGVIDE